MNPFSLFPASCRLLKLQRSKVQTHILVTNIAWNWDLTLRNLQTKHYFVNKKIKNEFVDHLSVYEQPICTHLTCILIKIPAFSTLRKYDSAVSTWNWRKNSDYFHGTYDELVVCCFSYFIYVQYKRKGRCQKRIFYVLFAEIQCIIS